MPTCKIPSGVFSLYDKDVYRHANDTDTASETEEEVPIILTLSISATTRAVIDAQVEKLES